MLERERPSLFPWKGKCVRVCVGGEGVYVDGENGRNSDVAAAGCGRQLDAGRCSGRPPPVKSTGGGGGGARTGRRRRHGNGRCREIRRVERKRRHPPGWATQATRISATASGLYCLLTRFFSSKGKVDVFSNTNSLCRRRNWSGNI